jgi:hypothetical protein
MDTSVWKVRCCDRMMTATQPERPIQELAAKEAESEKIKD